MNESQRKVLIVEVVEDETAIAQSLHDALERQGFLVIIAKDGVEGYAKALESKPNLILLDIVLPHIDGLTMLEKLRQDEWGKDVPVIALTNYGDAEKVNRAMKLGIREYLIKADWNLEDVIRQVKRRLEVK